MGLTCFTIESNSHRLVGKIDLDILNIFIQKKKWNALTCSLLWMIDNNSEDFAKRNFILKMQLVTFINAIIAQIYI